MNSSNASADLNTEFNADSAALQAALQRQRNAFTAEGEVHRLLARML